MWKSKPGARRQTITLLLVLLGLYAVLVIQYLHNRSLWIDEAMLSLNIIGRNAAGLFHPLDDFQVAPILFLLVEKSFVALFGNSEFALRIFPLLCSAAALPLFYVLCRYLTGNRTLSLCAMTLLGLAPSFVYYSSEVKQYMVDLLVLLVLYAVAFVPSPFLIRWRGLILSIAGFVAIFLSNVSVIPLFVIGLFYVYGMWRSKRVTVAGVMPMFVWMAFFLVNFFIFIYHHPHTAYMKDYWKNSFMPLNPFSVPFRKFTDKMVMQIFRDLLPSLPGGYLFLTSLLLYAGGLAFMLLKRDLRLLYLCLAPLIIHLGLSALTLYPFELRMLLYQAPLFVVVMAYGVWHSVHYFVQRPFTRRIALPIIIGLLTFKVFLRFPVNHDEIKPAIAYINKRSRPGESLYVFWGSIPATRYYMKTGLARFDSLSIMWGGPRSGSSASYLKDMRTMKGTTWLLISHLFPYNGDRTEEREVVHILMNRGVLIDHTEYYGSSLYKFDLR